jgi:glycosyltransferase involved in cell wall biosynthesis
MCPVEFTYSDVRRGTPGFLGYEPAYLPGIGISPISVRRDSSENLIWSGRWSAPSQKPLRMDPLRKKPVSISFISSLPPQKGISAYTLPLLKALGARADVKVEVFAFKHLYSSKLYPGGSPVDSTVGAPSIEGVSVHSELDSNNPLTWFKSAFLMKGRVIHAQWWSHVLAPVYVAMLGIAKIRGRKVVVTVHNVSPHEPSLWKAVADRAVLRLADHFIVHTPQNATALTRLLPQADGRISIIPMGPEDVYERVGVSKLDARRQLGLGRRERVVLFIGNIRPYKGLTEMLDAFELLSDRLPSARLLVVGQPWTGSDEVVRAVERAKQMQRVSLRLEYVPEGEVESYFAAADVIAYPYKGFEAQSGAAARGLSFGRAMLVSKSGGLSNLVRDERAVIQPGDSAGFAEAMYDVLTDVKLRRRLEQDTRAVAAQLNWNDIATSTVALYANLVGERAQQGPNEVPELAAKDDPAEQEAA